MKDRSGFSFIRRKAFFLIFLLIIFHLSFPILGQQCNNCIVSPSFTSPDTVCISTSVNIKNTSTGASNYYWNFCIADIRKPPTGQNLGNIGFSLNSPVYSDIVSQNGNFYVFIVNNNPGTLLRLDFGTSLLNTPTLTNLGDFSGQFPKNAEGIQIIQNQGHWYAIVVGGDIASNNPSKIVKIDFNSQIFNSTPAITDWGNLGSLSYPHDLYLFNEGENWYGFTVNSTNNTITKFSFGNNFINPPAAINLGNLGNLSYPTGITSININGKWFAFITNGISSTLTRLDFGSSLLNQPVATNLGNLNNNLHACWDISIIQFCGELYGFAINGDGSYNDIVKLNFGNSIENTPVTVSLGNIGNLSFPHSLSKLFREGSDIYSMITNANNNTVTRIKFEGCNNSSIPNSSMQNPPAISYSSPGLYNINLTVDEGMPTQSSYCKQIVVVAASEGKVFPDTTLCQGDSITLISSHVSSGYLWNTGKTTSSISVKNQGAYWVQNNYYGCTVRDSFMVKQNKPPLVFLGNDTAVCKGNKVVLNAGNDGSSYLWNDGSSGQKDTIYNSGNYSVSVKNNNNSCAGKDTISITQLPSPVILGLADTSACQGTKLKLQTFSAGNDTYQWSPAANLDNSAIVNPTITAVNATTYYLTVTNSDNCSTTGSIYLNVIPQPAVKAMADTSICESASFKLMATVSNAATIAWSPATGLNDSTLLNPIAVITNSTNYVITASKGFCETSDTTFVKVIPAPVITLTPDTTVCNSASIQLNASGGTSYSWFPVNGLSNPRIANPVASPGEKTIYYVTVTGSSNCSRIDSVSVLVKALTEFSVNPKESTICKGDTILLTASGGNLYDWSLNNNILNPFSPAASAIPTSSTTYEVIISDSICKVTDTAFARVNVANALHLTTTKSNDIDCNTGQAQLTVSGADRYLWQPGKTISDSLIYNPVVTPSETTTYFVTGKNTSGCIGKDSVKVVVSTVGDNLQKQLPNAFTPNNDGVNDCFGLRKWGYLKEADLRVYNRWGQLLFQSKSSNQCWDGTFKGVAQPGGAYVYQVTAQSLCGSIYRKGTIILLR